MGGKWGGFFPKPGIKDSCAGLFFPKRDEVTTFLLPLAKGGKEGFIFSVYTIMDSLIILFT